MTQFKPTPKDVKPLSEVIDTVAKRDKTFAAADPSSLVALEAKFSKPKTKAVKPKTTVDNNGWDKEFTPEQLANTVIDSDISVRSGSTKLSAKAARSASKKGGKKG